MKKEAKEKYFLIGLLILVLVLSLALIMPFFSAIFTGIVLAYIFHPLYRILNKHITNKAVCSIVLCILILIIILIPLFFVANSLVKESFTLYNEAKLNQIRLPSFLDDADLDSYFQNLVSRGSLFLVDGVSNFIFSIPSRIVDLFIILFLMYYLFKDGESLIKKVKELLPFDKKTSNLMTKEFSDITFAVVYGLLVTAIVQGIVGGIGFYIFKIPNPILWGTVMALIALIPFLGPFLVWLPIGLIELFYGNPASGIGILIYGILVISTIDNIVRPKIIGDRAKLHPAMVLIGVVGGIKMLGFIGVIAGPLVLALAISFLERYRNLKK